MADWKKIKAEYITTDTSYRKLAQKYGIAESTIYARGGKEHWVKQKEQYQSETVAKTIEAQSDKEVNRVARIMTVADKLLERVEGLVEHEDRLSATALKNLSDALKNIKDTQMIRTTEDVEEQKARIENLRRQAGMDQEGNVPKLIIEGLPEEFKA